MRRIDLVIFDLDGTLVDSAPDIAAALAATLREAGVPAPPLERVKTMVGDGARVLIRRAVGDARATADEEALFARFMEHYRTGLCVDSRLYPGVSEALDRLAAGGVPAAVLTNKPGTLARPLLQQLGIAGRLSAIVGDGDGYPRKPDPGAARAILANAGVGAAQAAVIGDGLPDVQLARALGARAVAAGWGYVSPDRLRAESPDVVAADPLDAVAAVLDG
ncbi:MAG TPA: HAD hydrolase-like protein [Polyangia bacterium]|nr:HAD hydrolase-like protein [Polyangia bacterium]